MRLEGLLLLLSRWRNPCRYKQHSTIAASPGSLVQNILKTLDEQVESPSLTSELLSSVTNDHFHSSADYFHNSFCRINRLLKKRPTQLVALPPNGQTIDNNMWDQKPKSRGFTGGRQTERTRRRMTTLQLSCFISFFSALTFTSCLIPLTNISDVSNWLDRSSTAPLCRAFISAGLQHNSPVLKRTHFLFARSNPAVWQTSTRTGFMGALCRVTAVILETLST